MAEVATGRSNAMEAEVDPMSWVAPEFREAAAQLALQEAANPPALRENIAQIRNNPFFAEVEPLPDVEFFERLAPVGAGHPDVLLYVINTRRGDERPAILHIHGGGHIAGSAKNEVRRLQMLARRLDCVIVTVEYRLAPEATYEASIEDNYAGLRWLHTHAKELGVDADRIVVLGESAGGGHAAILANVATDRGEFPIALQCLIYPMLDDRTGTTRRVPDHIGRLAWTADWNALAWEVFLGRPPGGEDAPAVAVPSRRRDLRNLPPAFIGVGAVDLFVEENVEYAQRLISAGVATELIVVPGAFHGFDIFAPETAASQNFERAVLAALRRGLRIPEEG
jgi:acetyl esterase/lipase